MTGRPLAYAADGLEFQGFYDAPEGASGLAGILVLPEAPGVGAHVKRRVEALAQAGYAALGVDLYGQGRLAASPDEARSWAFGLKGTPDRLLARMDAALEALAGQPEVDAERLGAAGYCYGGWCALELARAGRPLRTVTSFHGALASERGAASIMGSILVCTGDCDPFVPMDQVIAFQAEMCQAEVAYEVCLYGGVRHGFTNVDAPSGDPAFGYSPKADAHSWASFMRELTDAFGPSGQ